MGWAFISKLVKYSVSIAETDIISDAGVRHDPRYDSIFGFKEIFQLFCLSSL